MGLRLSHPPRTLAPNDAKSSTDFVQKDTLQSFFAWSASTRTMLEIGVQFLPDISVFHITEYNHIHQMVIYELPVAVVALRLTKQKIRKFSPASSSTLLHWKA